MAEAQTIEHERDVLGMDRPLTDAMRENRSAGDLIPFGEHGVSPQTFTQVIDWAKMMAKAVGVVGPALINNPGACLAVIELGQKFKFSPYMLARGCYSVNGVLAFDGQTIMAIMNKHMPLAPDEHGNKTRLKYEFFGEKTQYGEPEQVDNIDERTGEVKGKIWQAKVIRPSTRWVKVSGRMLGEADVLVYESPTVFNIKNKKSPLWVEDEDQQLRYWASRRWQRAHWPEGLLGIYDTDDAAAMQHIGADNAKLIEASDKPGVGLLERIKAAKMQTDDADKITGVVEGFKNGHAEKETGKWPDGSEMIAAQEKGVAVAKALVENVDSLMPSGAPVSADQGGRGMDDPGIDAAKPSDEPKATKTKSKSKKDTAKSKDDFPGDTPLPPADEKQPETSDPATDPTEPEKLDVPHWRAYCLAWIARLAPDQLDARWKKEIKLRNACGVTEKDRDEVFDVLLEKRDNGR